jgi:GrpB-like predicted nucleotidyltransferase (UPF0157 family)
MKPDTPKPLSDLTPAELGKLFPIILADYDERWPRLYEDERTALRAALARIPVRGIEHIGSTAVPGLRAKPTIDILVQVEPSADSEAIIASLKRSGYEYTARPENPPPHMMFMKGYTPEGFRGQAVHVHVRYPGDWDEPRFRDYLITHPGTAREYEALKEELARRFPNDREAYTERKTEFVRRVTGEARG